MKVIYRLMVAIIIIFAAIIISASAVGSSGGGSGSGSTSGSTSTTASRVNALYEKGVAADKAGDYKAAIAFFQDALKLDTRNSEVLNMLAHSQRMTGLIDEAIANYKKALAIRPDFPEAREYLGEAYIQAALREIEALAKYGSKGEEYRNDLISAFKAAEAGLAQ